MIITGCIPPISPTFVGVVKEYILYSCDSKYFGSLFLTKLGVGITENSIESLDIKFSCANKWVNAQQDVSEDIKDSDIVVSLGRGVYESMMCGRYVIVADERSYQGGLSDGSVNKDNIDKMMYSNCSGRAYMFKPTILHIKGEIEKYNKKDANFNKEYAIKTLMYMVILKKM